MQVKQAFFYYGYSTFEVLPTPMGDAHMVPTSPLAAILKNGYQLGTTLQGLSGDRMQVAKEACVSFGCSKVGL